MPNKPSNPIRKMRVTEARWRFIPHLLMVLSLLTLATSLDFYWSAQAAENEKMEIAGQFADCLSGSWRGSTPDGTQIACLPAETITLKEKRK